MYELKPRSRITCFNHLRAWLATIAVLLLGACSSTELTSVWVDEGRAAPVQSVLVVGISDDSHKRKIYEDAFVKMLDEKGVNAVAGYDQFPQETDLSVETLTENLSSVDVDALLVTHALGVDKESVYHPPRMEAVPFRYYDSFRGYYRTVYDYVHVPGYTTNHVIVRLETNLYDRRSQALMWSAQSKTIDPDSLEKLISELAAEVSRGLTEAGFIR